MSGQFRILDFLPIDQAPRGFSRWLSHPASTGAKQMAALDANLQPGKGHSFQMHPEQEEVLCVIDGEVEQWLDREKCTLNAGDAIFIAPGIVHATFNVSQEQARLLVFFSHCKDEGFEAVNVSNEAPWRGLRS